MSLRIRFCFHNIEKDYLPELMSGAGLFDGNGESIIRYLEQLTDDCGMYVLVYDPDTKQAFRLKKELIHAPE